MDINGFFKADDAGKWIFCARDAVKDSGNAEIGKTTRKHAALPAQLEESTDISFATAVHMASTPALGLKKLKSSQKMTTLLET